MKSLTTMRRRITKVLTVIVTATFLLGLFLNYGVSFSQDATATPQPPPEPSNALEAWNQAIIQIPRTKTGCFTATYPDLVWNEVLCVAAPTYPMPPNNGTPPLTIGNRNDVSAQAPSGHISTAVGSFDAVNNVTTESSFVGAGTTLVANAYTLQLNTDPFMGTVCTGSPNTDPILGCRGWEQFVFENQGTTIARVFIQYWIIRYNAPCPTNTNWMQFQFTGSTDIYCWRNDSAGAIQVTPLQPIANLGQLRLTGNATSATSTTDSATLSTVTGTGTTLFSVNGDNSVSVAAGWTAAEFNVFGDGGNSTGGNEATFNTGAEIIPRVQINYGGRAAPNCFAQGFTAETNNLSFALPKPLPSQPGPALIFRENTGGTANPSCSAATAVGDTHLTTFGGLLYDFQATGDFILANVDPDFEVQTRQISGAPNWPNASVNSAVAAQMGKTRVAICLGPEQTNLNIDGENTTLDDGKTIPLPDNADVSRRGNIYFIRDPNGNSVRAQVNAGYIDVSVGLGMWPAKVSGLLANANGNVSQIETRDGTVLDNPFTFDELYHRYADSWRVSPKESLLTVCGEPKETGAPDKVFTAGDLDTQEYRQALAICAEAGIEDSALRDACVLDVTVIGNKEASTVFVSQSSPIDVGKIVP